MIFSYKYIRIKVTEQNANPIIDFAAKFNDLKNKSK